MGIGHFLYIEHTGTVVLPWWGGGGEVPPGKKSMGGSFELK